MRRPSITHSLRWVDGLTGIYLVGTAVSTAYGHFHYAIDAVAGGVTGGGLYLLWERGYRCLERGRGSFVDDPSSRAVEAASELRSAQPGDGRPTEP